MDPSVNISGQPSTPSPTPSSPAPKTSSPIEAEAQKLHQTSQVLKSDKLTPSPPVVPLSRQKLTAPTSDPASSLQKKTPGLLGAVKREIATLKKGLQTQWTIARHSLGGSVFLPVTKTNYQQRLHDAEKILNKFDKTIGNQLEKLKAALSNDKNLHKFLHASGSTEQYMFLKKFEKVDFSSTKSVKNFVKNHIGDPEQANLPDHMLYDRSGNQKIFKFRDERITKENLDQLKQELESAKNNVQHALLNSIQRETLVAFLKDTYQLKLSDGRALQNR